MQSISSQPTMLQRILLFVIPTATIALVLADHGNPNLNPSIQNPSDSSYETQQILLCHRRGECI